MILLNDNKEKYFMKKTILMITMCASIQLQLQSESYKINVDNRHYENSVNVSVITETTEPIVSPDTDGLLNQIEVTNSSHVLGAGWFLFQEGVQNNFSQIPNFVALKNSNHTKFTLYNSDQLYLTFNRDLNTRDGSNIVGDPFWNISTATVTNINNVVLGTMVHYRNYSTISGLIFSNASAEPWCAPIHGRYNGTCFNGSNGFGDWKIYMK
jgi:hypothetical protein